MSGITNIKRHLKKQYFQQSGGSFDGGKYMFFPSSLDQVDDFGESRALFHQNVEPAIEQKRYMQFESPFMNGGSFDSMKPLFNQSGGEFSGSSDDKEISDFERIRNYISSQSGGLVEGPKEVIKIEVSTPTPAQPHPYINKTAEVAGRAADAAEVAAERTAEVAKTTANVALAAAKGAVTAGKEALNEGNHYPGTYSKGGGDDDDDDATSSAMVGGGCPCGDLAFSSTSSDGEDDFKQSGGKRHKKTKKKSKKVSKREDDTDDLNIFERPEDEEYGTVNVIPFYSADSSTDNSFKHPFNRKRFN